MSKKKSKKFKKIKKQSPVDQMKPAQSGPETSNSELIEEIKESKVEDHNEAYLTKQYDHVRRDIKKVTLIMTLILLSVVGFYFLNDKTPYLTNLGDWIYKVANIQTQ